MLRPCQFYKCAPDHVLGERMCGLPLTHKLIFGDENSLDSLDACNLHFALMVLLMRIMGRYLHYEVIDNTHIRS